MARKKQTESETGIATSLRYEGPREDEPFHPFASIFPMMDSHNLQVLAVDIIKFGQLEPIVLFEGLVLDGRNRWRVCDRLEIKAACVEATDLPNFDPRDALRYVISTNLKRRQLNHAARALSGARTWNIYEGEVGHRRYVSQSTSLGNPRDDKIEMSQPEIARSFDVTLDALRKAYSIVASATEGLLYLLDDKRITLNAAYEICQEWPKDARQGEFVQDQIVQAGVTTLKAAKELINRVLGVPTPGKIPPLSDEQKAELKAEKEANALRIENDKLRSELASAKVTITQVTAVATAEQGEPAEDDDSDTAEAPTTKSKGSLRYHAAKATVAKQPISADNETLRLETSYITRVIDREPELRLIIKCNYDRDTGMDNFGEETRKILANRMRAAAKVQNALADLLWKPPLADKAPSKVGSPGPTAKARRSGLLTDHNDTTIH